MVRFKTGPTPVNVGVINVSWPILPWQGLLQNAFTASKVASLNAQIDLLGGCGDCSNKYPPMTKVGMAYATEALCQQQIVGLSFLTRAFLEYRKVSEVIFR